MLSVAAPLCSAKWNRVCGEGILSDAESHSFLPSSSSPSHVLFPVTEQQFTKMQQNKNRRVSSPHASSCSGHGHNSSMSVRILLKFNDAPQCLRGGKVSVRVWLYPVVLCSAAILQGIASEPASGTALRVSGLRTELTPSPDPASQSCVLLVACYHLCWVLRGCSASHQMGQISFQRQWHNGKLVLFLLSTYFFANFRNILP